MSLNFFIHKNTRLSKNLKIIFNQKNLQLFKGMGMAMFTIVFNRIQVDWHAISFAVLGSLPGVVVGFQFVSFNFTLILGF